MLILALLLQILRRDFERAALVIAAVKILLGLERQHMLMHRGQ